MKTTKKGFTLIELIVVIAIIGVLAAILVPTMLGYVRKSKISSANSAASSVYKAINSTLTELDEEGVDVGGLWVLKWGGKKWSVALDDVNGAKDVDGTLGKDSISATAGAGNFDRKVSNFFSDITKIKKASAAIKGGSCVAIAVSTDKTYTGTYPGGIVTTDSYELYSDSTTDGFKAAVASAIAIASGDVKVSDLTVPDGKKLKLNTADAAKPAATNTDFTKLYAYDGSVTADS